MFQQIIVGTDGSEQALQAARVAGEMALKFQAQVTLLSVFDIASLPLPYQSVAGKLPYLEERHKIAEETHQQALRSTMQVLEAMDVPHTCRYEIGHPVDTIVRVAQEQNADLIVMGSRGMGTFKRFLLGSVSDGVLYHAHCPVLIVR